MQANKSDLAIVLVSGGMDSLVTAGMARQQYENLAFLHLNYGQKTESRELECFYKIADHFKIPHPRRKVIDVTFLKQIGGSSLTDEKINVANVDLNNPAKPTSYVPFRNTHIIAMAVSWAEVIGAKKIFVGAVYDDHTGYPDCRPSYYAAYNELIKQGSQDGSIRIETPIIHMNKQQIVQAGDKLKLPFEMTWSCYANSDVACGKCDSCYLRLKGFKDAGLVDPIEYVKA
jgi:7-cyano-7-deazaguanine synthase